MMNHYQVVDLLLLSATNKCHYAKFNTVSEHRLYYDVTKYSDHVATGSKGSKGTYWLCLVPTGGCIPIQCYLKETHITIQSKRC